MIKKCCDDFFKKLFLEHTNSLKNTICLIRNEKNLSSSEFNHCHIIDDEKSETIFKIIRKCHPSLSDDLDQLFENELDLLNFYQLKLINESHLIYTKKDEIFIPLLFDLNHFTYKSNKKNYDNNTK